MVDSGNFIINLIGAFGTLTAIILGFLAFFKDKIKMRIENENVKRIEVATLLKELFDDSQTKLENQGKVHREEIQAIERKHSDELGKRDIIIKELISRLPKESREIIQTKIKEMGLEDIINHHID